MKKLAGLGAIVLAGAMSAPAMAGSNNVKDILDSLSTPVARHNAVFQMAKTGKVIPERYADEAVEYFTEKDANNKSDYLLDSCELLWNLGREMKAAECYKNAGRESQAEYYAERSLEPGEAISMYLEKGNFADAGRLAQKAGWLEQARALYEKALPGAKERAWLYDKLSEVTKGLGREEESKEYTIKYANSFISDDPRENRFDERSYGHTIRILREAGLDCEARQAADEGVKYWTSRLEQASGRARMHLGSIYDEMGMYAEALKQDLSPDADGEGSPIKDNMGVGIFLYKPKLDKETFRQLCREYMQVNEDAGRFNGAYRLASEIGDKKKLEFYESILGK